MTRLGVLPLRPVLVLAPILILVVMLAACAPPAGYSNPDLKASYVVGNHLFDVRAVRAADGYDVYVAELGGPYLTDVVLLDTPAHVEAAEMVLWDRCETMSQANQWRTFGFDGFPQPSIGIVARFTCS